MQLVKQCNAGAHKMERTEALYTLHKQLDFGKVKVGRTDRQRPRPQARPRRPQTTPVCGGFPRGLCSSARGSAQ